MTTTTTSVRAVIDSNRAILVRNIILCPEFYDNIARLNVFPDSMLKDIKARSTAADQTEMLLELLSVRGPAALNSFCDALQSSGHNFLADLLRDEVRGGTSAAVQWGDLCRLVPSLEKTVPSQQRDDLTRVVNAKIRDVVQRELLRRAAIDKEKVIESKQLQMENSWRFTELLKEKDSMIEKLTGGLEDAFSDSRSHGVNVAELKTFVDDMKQKHKKDIETQMKYNTANEKSLQRLSERQYETEATLDYVTEQLSGYLRDSEKQLQLGDEAEVHELKQTVVERAKETLESTLKRIIELESIESEHTMLVEERQYMAAQIGVDANSGLRDAFRDYVVQQHETEITLRAEVTSLVNEVSVLKDAAAEQAVVETARLNTQRSSIADLQSTIESNNAVVVELRAEISSKEAILAAVLAENKVLQKKLVDRSTASPPLQTFRSYPGDGRCIVTAPRASPEGIIIHHGARSPSGKESPDAFDRLSPEKSHAALFPKPRIARHNQNTISLLISPLPPLSPRQKRKELRLHKKQQQQQLQQQRHHPDTSISQRELGAIYGPKTTASFLVKGDTKRTFPDPGWIHWPSSAAQSYNLRK